MEIVLDSFGLIFDNSVIIIISLYTLYTDIEAKKQENDWKGVDSIELKGFIDLLTATSKKNYEERRKNSVSSQRQKVFGERIKWRELSLPNCGNRITKKEEV